MKENRCLHGEPHQIRIEAKPTRQNSNAFEKIVVSDNGIGFDPKAKNEIFKTFTRLHSADNYEGTGLGLSLCKKIVERFGGSIVANGNAGGGATFTILLPSSRQ